LVFALGLAFVLPACAHREKKQEEPQTATQGRLQERQQSAQGASQALQAFEQERKQYHEKADQQLNELEAQIAQLKVQAPAQPEEREAHREAVANLERRLADGRAALTQLDQARPEEWRSRQTAVEQSILTAQAAYDATAARMAH